MSMSFGIASLLGGAKAALRKKALSKVLRDASNRAMPFLTETAGDLKQWGKDDWDHFKQTFRPTADALVDDANQAPDYNRGEREATLASARGGSDASAELRSDVSRSGAGVGSGRFAANAVKIAGNRARGEGVGQALGRQRAEQVQTNKKLNVIGMGRPDPSSAIAGLGVVAKGGAEYGKYSGLIGQSAGQSIGNAAKGLGQAVGSFKNKNSGYNSPDYNNSGSPDFTWGGVGGGNDFNSQNAEFGLSDQFADGGIIRGPGTGRSDSIPAEIDGERPARVSNGEYQIAANVVARIGKPRLDALIAIARGT